MRLQIHLESKKEIVPWRLGEYIARTSGNYTRMLSATIVCQSYWSGRYTDRDFLVAERLPRSWDTAGLAYDEALEYVAFAGKEADPDRFWQIIANRPNAVLYRRKGDKFMPLLWEPAYEFKVTSIRVQSPPEISLEGLGSTLVDLFYASEREARARDDFQRRQIGQTFQNVEHLARAAQVVSDSRTPPGVRAYAEHILKQAIREQERINEKIGIMPMSMDHRV